MINNNNMDIQRKSTGNRT